MIHVSHHGNHRRARMLIRRALFLYFLFLHDLLFETHHLHDPVERLGQICRRRRVERLIDARENSAIEQRLQQFLRANVELLREFAHRDSFGHRHLPRLTLHRRDWLGLRGAPCAHTRARAHRMKFALAFCVSLLDKRTAARRGRLARIQWLARFGFRNSGAASRTRTLSADGSLLTWTSASFPATAGTRRISSRRSASRSRPPDAAVRRDEFVPALPMDDNFVAHPDEALRRTAVLPDELDIAVPAGGAARGSAQLAAAPGGDGRRRSQAGIPLYRAVAVRAGVAGRGRTHGATPGFAGAAGAPAAGATPGLPVAAGACAGGCAGTVQWMAVA